MLTAFADSQLTTVPALPVVKGEQLPKPATLSFEMEELTVGTAA